MNDPNALCFRLGVPWREIKLALLALAAHALSVSFLFFLGESLWAYVILSSGSFSVMEIYLAWRTYRARRGDRLTLDALGISLASTSAYRKPWQLSWEDIRLPALVCADMPAPELLLAKTGALALLCENGVCQLDLLRLWRAESGAEPPGESDKTSPPPVLRAIERYLQERHPAAKTMQTLARREFLQQAEAWRLECALRQRMK
jgi:hypothetical protein